MLRGSSMRIAMRASAICAAMALGASSAAGSWLSTQTGMPDCRRSGEDRVPVTAWFGDVAASPDRDTPAPPPMPGGTIIYLSLTISQELIDNPDVSCATDTDDRSFTFKLFTDPKRPEAGGVRVHVRGEVTYHLGCTLSGFYISSPASNIREGWSDIWLWDNAGTLALYPRYCIVDGKHRLQAAKPKVLPECTGASDNRTPVPVWRPQLTARGELTSAPPQGDGMIVSIAIDTKRDANGVCAGWDHGQFGFLLAKDAGAAAPSGLLVTLLGNEKVLPDKCRLSGYYMNEPVFDRSGGLSRTHFSSVNAGRLVNSDQFCAAP